MEDRPAEAFPELLGDVRGRAGAEHEMPGGRLAVGRAHPEGARAEIDLAHLGAEDDGGQLSGDPLEVLVELGAQDGGELGGEEPVEAAVRGEEGQEGEGAGRIDESDQILQRGDLEGGLGQQQAGMPGETLPAFQVQGAQAVDRMGQGRQAHVRRTDAHGDVVEYVCVCVIAHDLLRWVSSP